LLYGDNYITRVSKVYFQSFYTTLEYLFFTFILWNNIPTKKLRRIILSLTIIFLAFQVLYMLFKAFDIDSLYLFHLLNMTSKSQKLDSIPIGIETILIFVYILFFFWETSRKIDTMYIYNHYCFWLAVGILIYLGGSFFFFILIDQLEKSEISTFGNITYLAEVMKNILFAVAIFIYSKHPVRMRKTQAVPYLDMI